MFKFAAFIVVECLFGVAGILSMFAGEVVIAGIAFAGMIVIAVIYFTFLKLGRQRNNLREFEADQRSRTDKKTERKIPIPQIYHLGGFRKMMEILIVMFLLSLSPVLALTVFFNYLWSIHPNPLT